MALSRLQFRIWHLFLVTFIVALVLGLVPWLYSGSLRVSVSTPHSEYVLGTPVPLELCVRNLALVTIPCPDHLLEYDVMRIYLSCDGEPFRRITHGGLLECRGEFPALTPCCSRRFAFTLLLPVEFDGRSEGKPPLVFDRPGLYRLFCELWPRDQGGHNFGPFRSNTLSIRITQPQGRDVEVWHKIDDRDFLLFLAGINYYHLCPQDKRQELRQVASRLLNNYPESGYGEALRMASEPPEYRDPFRCLKEVESPR